MFHGRLLGIALACALGISLLASASASANRILMPTLSKELAQENAIVAALATAGDASSMA